MHANSEPSFWDLFGNIGGNNQCLVTINTFPEGHQEGTSNVQTLYYRYSGGRSYSNWKQDGGPYSRFLERLCT